MASARGSSACLFCQTARMFPHDGVAAQLRGQFHLSRAWTRHQSSSMRPSIAPRPTIDLKHMRQNPELYAENCRMRNYKAQAENPRKIVALFRAWQELQRSTRSLRERNNKIKASLARGKSGDAAEVGDSAAQLEEARQLKATLALAEQQESDIENDMLEMGLGLPNLTDEKTPVGTEPKVLRYINDHPEPPSAPSDRVWRSHVHVGSELQLLDFAAASTTSGWGWYYLLNDAVKLEQALTRYACDVAERRGWTAVAAPSIVYSHIGAACGFQPRDQNGEQQVYTLEQGDQGARKPELSLAGTTEIPLAGMKANTTLEEQQLPLRLVGPSRCYRAEAGARGVDTKGLYRVHEFTKVEMFAWTLPKDCEKVFEEMLSIQSEILESLGLHCRVLEMPTADLGASASRKIDVEAFFPSRRDKDGGWGEVTSTSMCTDYQTRRLGTRVRMNSAGGKLAWPYTLNGTAMAIPRVLAALLEIGWDESRSVVHLPPVLRGWMKEDVIERRQNSF